MTNRLPITVVCMVITLPLVVVANPPPESALAPLEMTCVDSDATGYATFQSHNQKVVANRRGIFMTHIRTRNEAYTAQQWRLSWSTDQGRTFRTLYQATHATSAPVIESDRHDNLYLMHPDFESGDAFFYRFLAGEEFRDPLVSRIPGAAAGKYAMVLDPQRDQIYYFAHNNTFHTVALDGTVKSSVRLLRAGENGVLQYPLLLVDATGVLHAAWTTQRHGVYLYWDIHYLQSPDGGATWNTMSGAKVELPVIADEGGPADRITLTDEFESHTWLESFFVRGGKAHFLYLAQTELPRQHYVRYDLATGKRDVDLQPVFRGDSLALRNLDGFFASRLDQPKAAIYAVSRDAEQNRLACLASYDNGVTWRDHAVGPQVANLYSIGGCREVTPDGWIIGSFTERVESPTDSSSRSQVHFFRFRAQ